MKFYLLFLVILILQMVLVIQQSRHITKEYLTVKRKFAETAQIGMGTFRPLRSFKKGRIIILAVANNKIVDYRELSGRTVFSKFKQTERFIGLSLTDVLAKSTKEQQKAINIAMDNLSVQAQKQEGIKWI